MAINPETEFPGKITASDADYPYGSARNITTPGDGTGTPFVASMVNDLFGDQQATLAAAGIVPSGTPDKVSAAQYLQARTYLFGLVFNNVAELKIGQTVLGGSIDLTTTLGARVVWGGYYAYSDGGGNTGVIKTGAHTEDLVKIFTIDASTYIEADSVGIIDALQAGIKFDDSTNNKTQMDAALAAYDEIVFSNTTLPARMTDVTVPDNKKITLSSKNVVIKKGPNGFIFNLGRYSIIEGGTIDGNESASIGNSIVISVGENTPVLANQGHQLVSNVRFRNSDLEHITYTVANRGWLSSVQLCKFDEPTDPTIFTAIKWPDEATAGGNRRVIDCYSVCPIVNVNGCDNGFVQNSTIGIGTKGGDQGIYFPTGTTYSANKVIMTGNRIAVADANMTIRGGDHVFANNICAAGVTLDTTVSNLRWSNNDLTVALIDNTVKGTPNFIYHTETWAPTFRSSNADAAIGNGVLKGVRVWDGMLKYYRGRIQVGSTTAFGTGDIITDVLVEDLSDATALENIGTWEASIASAATTYNGMMSTGLASVSYSFRAIAGNMNAGFPWTWATGDLIKFEIPVRDFF